MFDKRFISRSITYFIALVLTLGTFPSLSFAQDQSTTVFTLGDESPAVPSTGAASSSEWVKIEDLTWKGNKPGTVKQTVAWKRLWGQTYFDTMQKIVQQGWKTSNVAVLARSDNYKDALSASSLAGLNNAPVLITAPSSLTSQTKAELTRMKVKKVYIVGGTSAVKPAVETAIKKMGITVERVWGQLADDTAVKVASKLGSRRASTCIVATDAGYWDALAASPYAYAKKAPIFLTRGKGSSLSAATINAIKSGKYKKVIIAGGVYAVKPAVETQLKKLGVNVQRLGGLHAVDTAAALANYFVQDYGMTYKNLGLATATGFQDALCGAALCGKNNSVIMLVPNTNNAKNYKTETKLITDGSPYVSSAWFATDLGKLVETGVVSSGTETATISAYPQGKYVTNWEWVNEIATSQYEDALNRILRKDGGYVAKNKELEAPFIFGGYKVISNDFYSYLETCTKRFHAITAIKGNFVETKPATPYKKYFVYNFDNEEEYIKTKKLKYPQIKDVYLYLEEKTDKSGKSYLYVTDLGVPYDREKHGVLHWFNKTRDPEGYYLYKATGEKWNSISRLGW